MDLLPPDSWPRDDLVAPKPKRRSIFDMSFKEALIEAAKRHPNSMEIVDASIREFPGPNSKDDPIDR